MFNLNVNLTQLDESRANYSNTLDPWLINNPEMIFYDSYCTHKVVNIFGDFPCNCRILTLKSEIKNAYWFNQNDLDLEAFAVNFATVNTFFESRLDDTFYLSQEMLQNHNQLTALLFGSLDFKYINGLEQLRNLEIFSIKLSLEPIHFPFESIGTLTNLKVLSIAQVPHENNTYTDNSICNLKQLVYFQIDYMQMLSQVPFGCIANQIDDLFYFSMTYMLLIKDIDPDLWNIKSLQSIFLDFSVNLKQSNLNFDTFNGYSQMLEKVSIQAPSEVCQSYTSNYQNIIIDQKEYSVSGYLYDNITKINNNNIQLVPCNNSINSYKFDYNTSW